MMEGILRVDRNGLKGKRIQQVREKAAPAFLFHFHGFCHPPVLSKYLGQLVL